MHQLQNLVTTLLLGSKTPNGDMVKCNGESCNNTLGNNNKSGFCHGCAQRNASGNRNAAAASASVKTTSDLNEGRVTSREEISAELMGSAVTDLTVAGLVNLITVVNKPLVERIGRLEEEMKSVTSQIDTLRKKADEVQGSLLSKTTEIADIRGKLNTSDTIQAQHKELRTVIDNHQRYLEKTDSFRRESNVVIFGLQESEKDADDVKEIFTSIGCTDVTPEKMKRLGKAPDVSSEGNATAESEPRNLKRPLLVSLKSQADRKTLLVNSSKLKDTATYKTIFVKKDQTPQERKEWARLRTVLQREKDRPENQGVSVKMDYRRRCVMAGERVIEKGNFHYGPEI